MLTVDTALETAVELIYIVAAVDATGFVDWEFVVMAVFFVSFGLASKAIDRLVIGAVRWFLAKQLTDQDSVSQ